MRNALCILALWLGFAGAALAQDAPDAADAPAPAAADAPATAEIPKITLDVADQDLAPLVKQFRALTGQDIRLGWDEHGVELAKADPPVRLTIALTDRHWEDALYRVAKAANCRVDRDGDTWILTRGPAHTEQTVIGAQPSEQDQELVLVRAKEVRRATQEIAIPFYVALIWIGCVLALWAWQCLALVLFPGIVESARTASERRPLLAPAIGIPNGLGLLLVGGAASVAGAPGALFSMMLFTVLFVLLTIGLAGKAEAMGRRLLSDSDRRPGRAASLSAGWGIMAGVSIVPIFGWVVLGWWSIGAVGSGTLALLDLVIGRGRTPSPGANPAARA